MRKNGKKTRNDANKKKAEVTGKGERESDIRIEGHGGIKTGKKTSKSKGKAGSNWGKKTRNKRKNSVLRKRNEMRLTRRSLDRWPCNVCKYM